MKEVELTITIRKTYTSFIQLARDIEKLKNEFFNILEILEPREDC